MAITNNNIADLEKEKFIESSQEAGKPAMRTETNLEGKIAGENQSKDWLDVNPASGSVVGGGGQVASLEVATSLGRLRGFVVTNNSGATAYYQVFDAGSLPADSTAPIFPSIPVANGASAFIDLRSVGGFPYTSGCYIAASSTIATKTITGASSQILAFTD